MTNKQLSQIKDLLKNNKRDRFVIFDNEEPALVVMSIDEYKKVAQAGRKDLDILDTDGGLVDNINRAIAEWKSNQLDQEVADEYEGMRENDYEENDGDNFYGSNENLSYYYDMDENDK